MKNRFWFVILVLLCLCPLLTADITLVNAQRGGVKLEWTLESYQITTVGDYSVVEFPGGSGLYGVGKPNLPSKQAFIEIPQDAEPRIRLSETVVETAHVSNPIVPAQEPAIDTIGEEKLATRFVRDEAAYQSSELFPAQVVEIAYQGIMRGRRLLLVRVNPIQYVAQSGEVRVYKHITIDIDFVGGTRSLGETDRAMEPIAQGLVLNYEPARTTRDDNVKYLIITVAQMEEQAKAFANWKMQRGTKAAVEIVSNNPTVAAVRAVIQKYYPQVAFVMILGDHPIIPLPMSASRHPLGDERCRMLGLEDGSIPSDLFYACLEGNDYYPDVYMGRVPANNAQEAEFFLGRLMRYQSRPPQGEWLKRFLLCGEFQYQSSKTNMAERLFCETAFTIWNSLKNFYTFPTKTIGTGSSGLNHKEYYFRKAADVNDPTKPGTYRSKIRDNEEPVVDCKMPDVWWPNITSDSEAKSNTIAFWNEGCFLVQHRDHGSETSWGKPSLNKTSVSTLTNGDKLPILFSVNCLTGAMDYSSDCFVEAALKNPNGGAVAAIGSTRVSYSWWNDRLCDGFYTCMYGTQVYDCMDVGVKLPQGHKFSKQLGVILNFGKMYLALNYPSNPWGTSYDYTEIEFYLFHCIGDPEMEVLTGTLTELTVATRGNHTISVVEKTSRAPVAEARVCLYDGAERQIVMHTDAQGVCVIPEGLRGNFTLTVTGESLYPYQTNLTLGQ